MARALNNIHFNIINIIIPLMIVVLDVVAKGFAVINREAFVNRAWFGLSVSSPLFIRVAFFVIAVVCAIWIRYQFALSFGFVIAGGISNMIDRFVYGGVIDYLRVGRAVFNIADLSIWIGCLMILFAIKNKSLSERVGFR